jgi:hypothetical protein
MMSILLAKNWWSLLIRGLAAILLGLITVLSPAITLGALVRLFFAYTLFDGLIVAEKGERWRWALLLEGIAGVVTAIVTMAWTLYSPADRNLDRRLWLHLWRAPDWIGISTSILDKNVRRTFTLPINQLAARLTFLSSSIARRLRTELIAPRNASSLKGLPKNAAAP